MDVDSLVKIGYKIHFLREFFSHMKRQSIVILHFAKSILLLLLWNLITTCSYERTILFITFLAHPFRLIWSSNFSSWFLSRMRWGKNHAGTCQFWKVLKMKLITETILHGENFNSNVVSIDCTDCCMLSSDLKTELLRLLIKLPRILKHSDRNNEWTYSNQ